ncbi:MAG TPA: MFS transporter [Mycobacteriales bacterium]|nr:MFS transporter [Mycobacteriales bacterium]
MFFMLGAISASWAARIPAIRAPLHLSDQALGLALLGPAAGAVMAMPAAGALLLRRAPRTVVLGALLPLGAVLPFVTVVRDAPQLFAVLFGWGCCLGLIDVAMNTEAVGVQDRLGQRVMSGFHGWFSLGGLAGAAVGAGSAWADVSVRAQLIWVSVVVMATGLTAVARFAPTAGRNLPDSLGGRTRVRWSRALIALAVIAFASFLAEGAANDWSAVYLRSSLDTSPGLAGAGYTCFALTMAAGRLYGDRLADRWGPRLLVRVSSSIGAAGWGAALVVRSPAAALAGLMLLGFGLSSAVPNTFSQASRLGDVGPALAVVTFCGYGGMLAGPAAIGALAGAVGLPTALAINACLAAVVAVLCGVLPSTEGRITSE